MMNQVIQPLKTHGKWDIRHLYNTAEHTQLSVFEDDADFVDLSILETGNGKWILQDEMQSAKSFDKIFNPYSGEFVAPYLFDYFEDAKSYALNVASEISGIDQQMLINMWVNEE